MFLNLFNKKIIGYKEIDRREIPLDDASLNLIQEGWGIKEKIDELKDRLMEIQDELMARHGRCSLVVPGLCRVSLTERQTVRVADPDGLAELLGSRMRDLVIMRTSFHPTPKLIEMAADADDPQSSDIAACLRAETTPVVTWRAER